MVLTHNGKVLFGPRHGATGDPEWQLPGGWIEPGESLPQAARREVFEETGLAFDRPEFVAVTNNIFSAQFHSITLYFEAECVNAAALAPEGCDEASAWQWKNWTDITENLFLPLRLLKQSDYRPFLRKRSRTHVSF